MWNGKSVFLIMVKKNTLCAQLLIKIWVMTYASLTPRDFLLHFFLLEMLLQLIQVILRPARAFDENKINGSVLSGLDLRQFWFSCSTRLKCHISRVNVIFFYANINKWRVIRHFVVVCKLIGCSRQLKLGLANKDACAWRSIWSYQPPYWNCPVEDLCWK